MSDWNHWFTVILYSHLVRTVNPTNQVYRYPTTIFMHCKWLVPCFATNWDEVLTCHQIQEARLSWQCYSTMTDQTKGMLLDPSASTQTLYNWVISCRMVHVGMPAVICGFFSETGAAIATKISQYSRLSYSRDNITLVDKSRAPQSSPALIAIKAASCPSCTHNDALNSQGTKRSHHNASISKYRPSFLTYAHDDWNCMRHADQFPR